MANRRNETSRQRRARENRARRAALEARKKAAQTPREERVAPAAAGPSGGSGKERRNDGKGSARQAMAQGRLGQTPVDIDSLQGSFLGKVVHVPGGMQVIMSAVLVVVLTIMGSVMDTLPEEGAEVGSKATRTLFEAYGAGALLYLVPPLLLVANALVFSLNPRRRRMWIVSAVMMAIFSLVMLQFIFPAGFLAYAAWRSKRIEDGPRRAVAADDDVDDDVDEADEAGGPAGDPAGDPVDEDVR